MSTASGPISSKLAGEKAESAVLEAVPELEYAPDSDVEHADARASTLLEASAELPIVGMALVERGTLVEIKSAIARHGDGGRGRFYLRREQHAQLLADSGVYVFAVCEPRPARDVIALKVVPATGVDALVGDDWRGAGDGRPECYQLSWGRVFDDSEVSR